MPFDAHERERLLAAKGVGPTVVARLEQIGYHALADLAQATPTDINAQIAAMLGTTCWRNSPQARTLTVGLQVFSSVDQGVDWSVITAATLMTAAPLLIAFLLFQRQFVQSFMRAGIK